MNILSLSSAFTQFIYSDSYLVSTNFFIVCFPLHLSPSLSLLSLSSFHMLSHFVWPARELVKWRERNPPVPGLQFSPFHSFIHFVITTVTPPCYRIHYQRESSQAQKPRTSESIDRPDPSSTMTPMALNANYRKRALLDLLVSFLLL